MVERPSASSIRELGRRLHRGTPRPGDEDALDAYILSHHEAMQEVSRVLRDELSLANTPRLKTRTTLREKLDRERTDLSRMDDIAGVRLDPCTNRREQDLLAKYIEERFPGSRRVDRRANPKHGYRAFHLVVNLAGWHVEVQIRTHYQHMWADGFEKLADILGRDIRYGAVPEDETYGDICGLFLRMAELGDKLETHELDLITQPNDALTFNDLRYYFVQRKEISTLLSEMRQAVIDWGNVPTAVQLPLEDGSGR